MDIGKRIIKERELKGWNQRELARRVNINVSVMNRIESGERPIKDLELIKIAEVLNVKTDYLLGIDNVKIKPVINSITPIDEFIDIPILGTIYAGTPLERIEHHEGTYPVLKKTINGYDAFWLKVKGESMSGDEIHDGDLVCIIVTTEVNPSDIAAVAINGDEATLKRVKCSGETCILTPSNREMEPFFVKSKDVHIIGKVVGFQRYFK